MDISEEKQIWEQPEDNTLPALLMQEIKEKTVSILWEFSRERYVWVRKMKLFIRDEWLLWLTKNQRWEEIIFFISKAFIWDNREIHLYRKRQFKWKMMIKLRDDSEGENFVRKRIEEDNFEEWFEIPKTPIISSIPPEGSYYHPERDGTLEAYIEKRREFWEGFFFQTYEEYLQLSRAGYIDEYLAQSGKYSMRIVYTEWRPDEYHKLTGLLSCEPVLWPRPGRNTDRRIKDILEEEGVIGWEILGIFPEPPSSLPIA